MRAPGWASSPPAASSGAASAHSAAAGPFPKPQSPRRQETPGSPSQRVSDRGSGREASPPPRKKARKGSLTRRGRGGCSGARGARGSPKVEGHSEAAGTRGPQRAAPAILGALRFLIGRGRRPRIAKSRLFSGLAYEAETHEKRGGWRMERERPGPVSFRGSVASCGVERHNHGEVLGSLQ